MAFAIRILFVECNEFRVKILMKTIQMHSSIFTYLMAREWRIANKWCMKNTFLFFCYYFIIIRSEHCFRANKKKKYLYIYVRKKQRFKCIFTCSRCSLHGNKNERAREYFISTIATIGAYVIFRFMVKPWFATSTCVFNLQAVRERGGPNSYRESRNEFVRFSYEIIHGNRSSERFDRTTD